MIAKCNAKKSRNASFCPHLAKTKHLQHKSITNIFETLQQQSFRISRKTIFNLKIQFSKQYTRE